MRARSSIISLGLGLLLGASAREAGAQEVAPARAATQVGTTGIFARVGVVTSMFNGGGLVFSAQTTRAEREARGITPAFTGKQLGWSYMALPGLTVDVAVDARWFYARVGLDLYTAPSVTLQPDLYRAEHATQAFLSLGPRFVLSDQVSLTTGVRLGALLMNVSTPRNRAGEYSAVAGIGAVDVGVQWRPTRWLELDATAGHDLLSGLHITTVGLAASFGWSRAR